MNEQRQNDNFLYISPSLDVLFMPRDPAIGHDIRHENVTYRRLDGPYFCWLRHRFNSFIDNAPGNAATADEVTELFRRWEIVEGLVEERVGKEKLSEIVKRMEVDIATMKKYEGPGNEARK